MLMAMWKINDSNIIVVQSANSLSVSDASDATFNHILVKVHLCSVKLVNTPIIECDQKSSDQQSM